MKLKRLISSLLLAIYLVAGCGGMFSVILCHCHRSQHFLSHHSCCCSHHCCANHNGEGIKAQAGCNCLHDHSTEIDLYNHERSVSKLCPPIICLTLPTMQEQVLTTESHSTIKRLDRRKIPLPTADFVALKGLRAPPVIA